MKTKNFKSFTFISVVLITFVLMLSNCTTVSPYNPSLPQISISKAEYQDIRHLGSNFSENPYMEPKTLLRGKLYEFFVVKIIFNLQKKENVTILAETIGPDGKEPSRIYSQYSFIEFWDSNTSIDPENDVKNQRKITSINRSCVPSFSFNQNAGLSVLFIPIVGKNPMPRPTKISIQVLTDSGESSMYSYSLE